MLSEHKKSSAFNWDPAIVSLSRLFGFKVFNALQVKTAILLLDFSQHFVFISFH